jgi:hypothetical protein
MTDSFLTKAPPLAFAADNPAVIGEPPAADLLRTATFTHGVDELDPIGVDDPKHRRGGQKDLCPSLVGREEAKEPCPFGYAREQRAIVPHQPAIKRAIAHAFQRMEEPQGHDFTGPQGGMRMLRDVLYVRIDLTEESDDKIHSGHGLLRTRQGFMLPTSVEKIHDYCNTANEPYWFARD